MSEHHHASEAIYHPIPQAPVASNPIPEGSPDLDLDDDAALSGSGFIPTQNVMDSRIHWAHFMLGCAVLLPWNGALSLLSGNHGALNGASTPCSLDHSNTVLPSPRRGYFTEERVLFLPIHDIYRRQLPIPCTCDRHREEG